MTPVELHRHASRMDREAQGASAARAEQLRLLARAFRLRAAEHEGAASLAGPDVELQDVMGGTPRYARAA